MFKFGAVGALAEVPEEFRSYYNTAAGADGKFTVADAHKGLVNAYLGQANAAEEERKKVANLNNENAQRRQAVKQYEDLVTTLGLTVEGDKHAEALKAHIDDLTGKVKGGEAFKGDLAKIKADAEKRIADVVAAKDGEITAMRTTLEEHLIGKEVLGELAKAKAKNGGQVLIPHVTQKLKVVKDETGKYAVRAVDEKGDVRYNAQAQPMGVPDVVAEVKRSPDFAFAFESETKSGAGTPPNNAAKPNPGTPPVANTRTNSVQNISEGLAELTGGR